MCVRRQVPTCRQQALTGHQPQRCVGGGGPAPRVWRAARPTPLLRPVQICWHTAQLKPRFFNAFFLSGLPPPEVDRAALWRQVAAESLPLLNNTEVRRAGAACRAALWDAAC